MDNIFPSAEVKGNYKPVKVELTSLDLPKDFMTFLEDTKTSGLSIYKDQTLVYEYYNTENPKDQYTSFSVAKTYVATLVGILYTEGKIESLDDTCGKYVPATMGTTLGNKSISDVLEMRTGVMFSETYKDKSTDIYKIFDQLFLYFKPVDEVALSYPVEDHTEFEYTSITTQFLKMLVESIEDKPINEVLSEKLWIPLDCQDANWLTDKHKSVTAWWGLNTNHEAFFKLGYLYMNKGYYNNQQLLSESFIDSATNKDRPVVYKDYWKYGYQIWLPPSGNDYMAIGIWGQLIYINPDMRIVIVKTSFDEEFPSHEIPAIDHFRNISTMF
jgi:CubicO group peptidase (beta-lactamase class C family)